MTLALAVAIGVAVGLLLGSMGAGGAIITIPVLTYVFGMTAHASTTGSLVIVGLSSVVALIAHTRAGRVAWRRGLIMAAFGAVGAVGGSLIAQGWDQHWLLTGFAVLLAVVGVLMLRAGARAVDREVAPLEARTVAATGAVGLGVGLLTGFFGVGGGFAIVPALTLVLGLPMPIAAATSLLVIASNSAVALVAKLAGGVELDWVIVAFFTLGTGTGSLIGAGLSERMPAALLKKSFAVLVLVVAAFMLVQSVWALAS